MKNKPVSDVFRKRVGRYYVGRTLGEGTYAKVKYGQHMDTGEAVAIKVLNKDELIRADMVSQIKREIRIMKNLHHPNVVDLKEVVASKDKVYMVMELMAGGELFDKVVAEGPFKEEEGRRVLQQLLDGLEYVHKQGIYHRDLKPENVLLSADGSVKLSDFGLGALPTHGREDGLLRTTCGTPNYVAPEVLQRNGYEGAPADIWSLGVCLYVVMAGSLPFDEPNLPSLFRKISRADYSTPIWFSPGLCQVLQGMLQPDPEKRATIEQLRQHPWVRKDYHQPRQLARTSTDSEDIDTSVDIFGATVKMHHLTPEEQRDSLKQMPRLTSMGSMQGGASSLKHLNAFEMINAALDISSLFERRDDVVRRHTRFTSKQPKATVLSKLEAAAVSMGGSVRRRSQYRAKLTMPGARGPVSLAVEVFDVIPGTSLAECVKAKGDTVDFYTAYAALTEHVQGLIANNLMRSVSSVSALAPLPVSAAEADSALTDAHAAYAHAAQATPGDAGPAEAADDAGGDLSSVSTSTEANPSLHLARAQAGHNGMGEDSTGSLVDIAGTSEAAKGPGQTAAPSATPAVAVPARRAEGIPNHQASPPAFSRSSPQRDDPSAAVQAALEIYKQTPAASGVSSRTQEVPSALSSPRQSASSTDQSPRSGSDTPVSPTKRALGWLQGKRGKALADKLSLSPTNRGQTNSRK